MSNLIQIQESEIEGEDEGCPYCGSLVDSSMWLGCCGETHFEKVYVMTKEHDGEPYYFESEVEIINDGNNEQKIKEN